MTSHAVKIATVSSLDEEGKAEEDTAIAPENNIAHPASGLSKARILHPGVYTQAVMEFTMNNTVEPNPKKKGPREALASTSQQPSKDVDSNPIVQPEDSTPADSAPGNCTPEDFTLQAARSHISVISRPAAITQTVPPPAPRVDREFVRQCVAVGGTNPGRTLVEYRRQKAKSGNRDHFKDTRTDEEVDERLQAIRKNVTRKRTLPGRRGEQRAHLSSLRDVYALIPLVQDRLRNVEEYLATVDVSLYQNRKYVMWANTSRWKLRELYRQIDVLEWLEHAERRQHSSRHPDLIQVHVMDPFPFEESWCLPQPSDTTMKFLGEGQIQSIPGAHRRWSP